MSWWDKAGSAFRDFSDLTVNTLTGKVDREDPKSVLEQADKAEALKNQYLGEIGRYENRSVPMIDASQFAQSPTVDLGMFQNAAEGNTPSAAALQLRQGQEQNLKNQLAMIASQRGGFNPGAMRQAQVLGAEGGQQVNAQAAQLRAQEMANARAMYLQGLQGNQSANLTNQGRMLDAYRSNQAAQLQGRSIDDSAANTLRSLASGQGGQAQQAVNTIYSGNQSANAAETAARAQMVGGILSAGGALGAASMKGAAHGGMIPGKAEVKGDSYANDTVPLKLSPGELVVPRTVVAQGPKAVAKFAEKEQKSFVDALPMAKGGEVPNFGELMSTMQEMKKRLSALEAKKGGKKNG